MRSTIAICVGLIVAGTLAISSAQAQPTSGFHSAGWKQGVDTYWPARSASRAIDNAREYAQDFQNYVTKMPSVEPSVVKDVKVELSRYLDEAAKHLATMKKDFAGDKPTLAAIEKVEKELAGVVENQKAMIECCEHEKFDKIAGMACCKDFVKELDKVHAAHQNLMKTLAAKHPAPAKATK
jgi:hypothetical protein